MTLKTEAVIIVYSCVLTAAFIGALYLFRLASTADAQTYYNNDQGIYILSSQEWVGGLVDGSIFIQPDKITSFETIANYYANKNLEYFSLVMIAFLIFFLCSSFMLWRILRHIQQRETLQLVEDLKIDDNGNIKTPLLDPIISASVEKIHQKLLNHFEDYSRLNSYVSHEQKNTIAVLRANLEIKGDQDALKMIDKIAENMDDILILSDSTAPSVKESVDIALVCASACDAYANLSKNIVFDFDENDNTTIYAKERWIDRAVRNLLDNAVKYGEGRPVEVAVKSKHGSVILTVRDYGIGIPEDKQEYIFQNRYRLNALNQNGYGIGLSLVAHVCDLCGGFVFVESVEHQSTCFYLAFPQYNENS